MGESQARASTSSSLFLTISVWMTAVRSPPRSERQPYARDHTNITSEGSNVRHAVRQHRLVNRIFEAFELSSGNDKDLKAGLLLRLGLNPLVRGHAADGEDGWRHSSQAICSTSRSRALYFVVKPTLLRDVRTA
jgi:hypothetical protein